MIHSIGFRAMGSQILAAVDSPSVPDDLSAVPAWFEGWERTLSRFRLESELNRVNRAGGMSLRVSRDFAEVFEAAWYAEQLSGGLVTPVLLDALVRAGYDRSFDLLPRDQAFSPHGEVFSFPRLEEVDWDASKRRIWLPPDLHLDFGGVAKGWAANQAAERLGKHGPVLVDAGGDISVTAAQSDGSPWLVGIANPFEPSENLEILRLARGGVATSGRDARNWLRGGRLVHHIIDPRTGLPAETDVLTATVVSPSVMQAEAAAKTILILGSEAGLHWLEGIPESAAMLVLECGSSLQTASLASFINEEIKCL